MLVDWEGKKKFFPKKKPSFFQGRCVFDKQECRLFKKCPVFSFGRLLTTRHGCHDRPARTFVVGLRLFGSILGKEMPHRTQADQGGTQKTAALMERRFP